MNKQVRFALWLALWGLSAGFPLFAQAAEAPDALTFTVKDQTTDRPLPSVSPLAKMKQRLAGEVTSRP